MTSVDPKQFTVQAVSHEEGTFQEMVAEQMRRAPWLALSLGAHAFALVLLWVLVPAEAPEKPRNFAEVVDTWEEAVQPIEPPKPIDTTPEKIETEIDLVDDPVVTNEDPVDVITENVTTSTTLSAFTANRDNTALGMGGNAGGPYGQRGRRGGPSGRALVPPMEFALKWLDRHQDEDGKWDCDQFMKHDVEGEICDGAGNAVHDIGVTGLALLAFLGDNNTMRAGPYRDTVKKGVQWLRSQQQENGLFGTNTSHDFIYDHAIASYAMCEAFGLSNYRTLKPVAQKAINYLESHRNPYGVWRYQPRDNDNDTSVTGWCIMAYESGEFFGLQINKTALELCETWLDQVSDNTGHHGYTKHGEASSRKRGDHQTRFPVDKGEAMTAVGLFSRFFMGQNPKENQVMDAAADLVLSKPPTWNEQDGSIDHYYWYYATYALFQAGGRHWREWRRHLEPALLKHQHQDSSPAAQNLHGSWDPVGVWGDEGGRVYSTAILALCLQAHFRYSPLLR